MLHVSNDHDVDPSWHDRIMQPELTFVLPVQIPKGRFCLVFFAIYLFQVTCMPVTVESLFQYTADVFESKAPCAVTPAVLQYAVFGFLYYLQAEHCIKGVKHYLHALWFSVQTAATIGYGGDLSPDPYCSVTNALVTCQVIISLLTDYSMLGIVFTRFANPTSRTSTIRFSKQMAMTHRNGIWQLTFRVANIRKHQILRPEIRILLLRFNSKHPDADDAGYLHQELQITSGGLTPSKIAWLGLPTSMSHIIDADSPLAGMMPADMEKEDMEILVLLDGIDATTSGVLQAR